MANPRKAKNRRNQALDRITQGVDSFNNWRKEFPTMYIDLSYHDFSGMDLPNINFMGIKLKKANFSNCNLHNTLFNGANLNDANFTSSNCSKANFFQARLLNADFTNANINDAIFYSSTREGIIFDNVICNQCWISKDIVQYPLEPEVFQDGEFELIYGGKRFKVYFDSGMQPIDLLALPFYAENILEHFKGHKLVFTGLSTIGDTGLEFRIESSQSLDLKDDIQRYMNDTIRVIRNELKDFYESRIIELKEAVSRKDKIINEKDRFLQVITEKLLPNNNIPYVVNNYTTNYNLADNELLNSFIEDIRVIRNNVTLDDDKNAVLDELEAAAKSGNTSKFKKMVKASGKWLFEISNAVGTSIFAEYLKQNFFM